MRHTRNTITGAGATHPFIVETFGLALIREYERLGFERYFTPEQIEALKARAAQLEAAA